MLNSKVTTVLLISFCGLLGYAIHTLLNDPQFLIPVPMPIVKTESSIPETITINQINALAGIEDFDEIIQRPLFSKSRQPNVEEVVVEEKVIPPPLRKPDLNLMGVVITSDEKIALIKSRNDTKPTRVKLEEDIHGWKVTRIKSRSIKMESAGQSFVLQIEPSKNRHRNSTPRAPSSEPPALSYIPPPPPFPRNKNKNTKIPPIPIPAFPPNEEIDL